MIDLVLICPECQKFGQSSQLIEIFNGWCKLGSVNNYIDEFGKYHYHDPNCAFHLYRCTNGHDIKRIQYNPCHVATCKFAGGTTRLVAAENLILELT